MRNEPVDRQPLVEIKNLYAGYNNEIILDDINLSIQQDDFIGLIGPNGGGKTTLLKVIIGLIKPQQGLVRVMGETPEKGRAQIGYVPQFAEYDAAFPISVRDVVRMGRLNASRIFKPFTKEDDDIVRSQLERVGLLKYQDRTLRELSGGQRQRVYIARALATHPKLLVLDEPTVSVDQEARTQIYELLYNLNQQGVTIFLVTHDLNVVSSYVKTIGCMNRKLHYHGEKELTEEMISSTYGCPVDLIAHGLPHRVFAEHEGER